MRRLNCLDVVVVLLAALVLCGAFLSLPAQAARNVVPGMNELVVFDPAAHERGLSAVKLVPNCRGDLVVQIPPTVHVHRFYYNGDKEFQGPILQGGATVVVATHPGTGDKMYIDVSLPPGAPKIIHSASSITYLYTDQRVILKLAKGNSCTATVQHARGQGFFRRWEDVRESVKGTAGSALQRSALVESMKQTAIGGTQLTAGALGAAETGVAGALDAARAAAGAFPGVEPLRSYGADRPARKQLESARNAAARESRSFTEYYPTNR